MTSELHQTSPSATVDPLRSIAVITVALDFGLTEVVTASMLGAVAVLLRFVTMRTLRP